MADVKISQLPEVTALSGSDVIPVVASGVTSKIQVQNLGGSLSTFTKFWVENVTQSLQPDQTIVVSDNYVMNNSLLILSASAENYAVGPLSFQKKAQLYIGGHLLLVDTNVINDGVISVAGGVILSGSSTIIGTGILI